MEKRGEELLLAGKAFWRDFSRARVLAWKRGPDCVNPTQNKCLEKGIGDWMHGNDSG